MDNTTKLTVADIAFLRHIGGQPLEGSGHEDEVRAQAFDVSRQDLHAIGSLTCFLEPDQLPPGVAATLSAPVDK